MSRFLVIGLCVAMSLNKAGSVAHAEGKFHFYNTLESKHPFRVVLTGAETGRTVQSDTLLTFKGTPWTQPLVGGRYYIVLRGRGWSRDLGWHEFDKTIPEGNVMIGRDDHFWGLREEKLPDGSIKKTWEMAAAAPANAPPPQLTAHIGRRQVQEVAPGNKQPANGAIQQVAARPLERRRMGMTVHKCAEGIHVDSVDAGGAARRCKDQNGNPITLEPGDHILSWNGKVAANLEEFLEWVATSDEADFLIKDARTGGQVRLKAKLD